MEKVLVIKNAKKLQKLYDCLPIHNWLLVYNKFDIKWIFHEYLLCNKFNVRFVQWMLNVKLIC